MGIILENQEPTYDGNDLGAVYTPFSTTFKVWAPTVKKITVLVYENFEDDNRQEYEMAKLDKGIWELVLVGDFKNKYYNYLVLKDGVQK
ncbi:MAG: hypothetical protein MUO60_08260, partial [Clostridiaceae bacterium]|nr:hypothetical protein [Clostridiaceae bacterium]